MSLFMPRSLNCYMPNDIANTAVLLLAAGASTRLGHPKQLIKIGEQSLLEKAAGAALDSGCSPVLAVLGAYAEKVKPLLQQRPVLIVENKNWESGMGSSIACGMEFLIKEFPDLEAVILMLCDQPFVQADTLQKLLKSWRENGAGIVAADYGTAFGPPALFDRRFFPQLCSLQGEKGAKSVMLAHRDELVLLPFPEGGVDLDTAGDLEKWGVLWNTDEHRKDTDLKG